jgi:hypothetical protein
LLLIKLSSEARFFLDPEVPGMPEHIQQEVKQSTYLKGLKSK